MGKFGDQGARNAYEILILFATLHAERLKKSNKKAILYS